MGKMISMMGNTNIGTRMSNHRTIGINPSVNARTGGDIMLSSPWSGAALKMNEKSAESCLCCFKNFANSGNNITTHETIASPRIANSNPMTSSVINLLHP